jgi:hypothetical protein
MSAEILKNKTEKFLSLLGVQATVTVVEVAARFQVASVLKAQMVVMGRARILTALAVVEVHPQQVLLEALKAAREALASLTTSRVRLLPMLAGAVAQPGLGQAIAVALEEQVAAVTAATARSGEVQLGPQTQVEEEAAVR